MKRKRVRTAPPEQLPIGSALPLLVYPPGGDFRPLEVSGEVARQSDGSDRGVGVVFHSFLTRPRARRGSVSSRGSRPTTSPASSTTTRFCSETRRRRGRVPRGSCGFLLVCARHEPCVASPRATNLAAPKYARLHAEYAAALRHVAADLVLLSTRLPFIRRVHLREAPDPDAARVRGGAVRRGARDRSDPARHQVEPAAHGRDRGARPDEGSHRSDARLPRDP